MQASNRDQLVSSNEEAVMAGFKEGREEAFRVIYDKMATPLLYFVENIIKSQVDAEDIVANAFYKLYHAREGLRSVEHIKRWLYVIVRNESIDFLRLRARQMETKYDIAYLEAGSEDEMETERVRTLLLQDIRAAIDELPGQRRKILRLYFFEEKTTAEIAKIMQLKPQTVLNHKTKAIESLRRSGLKLKWLLEGMPTFVIAATFYLITR